MRTRLEESSLYRAIEDKVEAFPMLTVLRKKFANSLAAMFIVGLGASIINLLFLFSSAYVSEVLHIRSEAFIWYRTLGILVAALLCIVFGARLTK